MGRIRAAMELAAAGKGGVLLLAGEAGVGKTRLLEEAVLLGREMGLTALLGRCVEGSTPFLPWREALERVPLGSLGGAGVDDVFLFSGGGTLLHHDTTRLLLAVRDEDLRRTLEIVRAALAKGGPSFTEQGVTGAVSRGPHLIVVVTAGGELEPAIVVADRVRSVVEARFAGQLASFAGDLSSLRGVDEMVQQAMGTADAARGGAGGRERVFDSALRTLLGLAGQRPVLIAIDDLQWIDASSLDLLRFVGMECAAQRILILAAYRPEDLAGDPRAEALADLAPPGGDAVIALGRLQAGATDAFVHALYPESRFPEQFIEFLVRHTEGNPFFLEETLFALESRDRLPKGRFTRWAPALVQDLALPATVREMILRRIDHLEKEEREVLQYAAALGNEFDGAVLTGSLDRPGVERHLATFVRDHLVRATGAGRFRFDHDLIREVAYQSLSPAIRRLIHRRLGETLEEFAARGEPQHIFALADQYAQTHLVAKALAAATRAAEVAERTHALREAVHYYQIAHDASVTLKDRASAGRFLLRIARLLELVGDWDQALLRYEEVTGTPEDRALDTERTIEAFRGQARLLIHRNRTAESREPLSQALQLAEESGSKRLAAGVLVDLARAYRYSGDIPKAYFTADKARALAQEAGDEAVLAEALAHVASTLVIQGETERAEQAYREAEPAYRRLNDMEGLANLPMNMGVSRCLAGDDPGGLELLERALAEARGVGSARITAYALANAAEVLGRQADTAKATDYATQALRLFERLGERGMLAQTHLAFAFIEKGAGRPDAAEAHARMAAEVAEEMSLLSVLAQAQLTLGKIAEEGHRPAEARAAFTRAADLYRRMGGDRKVEEILRDIMDRMARLR